MKKIFLLLFLSLLVYTFSCKKKEVATAPVAIELKFEYDDSTFVINKVYDYPLDYDLKIEQLKLYLSNVAIQKDNGEAFFLSEIFFVDASSTGKMITGQIPEGVYTNLIYSIGVPEYLNGTQNPDFDAALYSPTHPLSLSNGMYWTWASGYRFVLLDGRVNTNPSTDEDFETLLSIHTGKDYSYRTKSISMQKTAVGNTELRMTMVFNVEKFLAGDADVIDIAVDNQSHGTNEGLANRMSDNVMDAVSIQ